MLVNWDNNGNGKDVIHEMTDGMKRRIFYILTMLLPFVAMASAPYIELIGNDQAYLYGRPEFKLICGEGDELSDINWSIALPLTGNGGEQVIITQTGGSDRFVAECPDDLLTKLSPDQIEHTKGTAQATVTASAKANGMPVIAKLSIPLILTPYVSEPRHYISASDEGSYELMFEVDYAGNSSPWVHVAVEYEFDHAIQNAGHRWEQSPYRQTVKILKGYDVWIDIQVSNAFGRTTRTIELPKDFAGITDIPVQGDEVTGIRVYTLQGRCIGEFNDVPEISGLPKGVYVIEKLSGTRVIGRVKHLVR